ncbi:heparinase II/III family protein [Bacteroides xylanisolvens]|uniref:heparinase II/III domain-containing protein n=1 Tax=Bacteroides xylanisolvens TaxID=371601 RepID=UPI0035613858
MYNLKISFITLLIFFSVPVLSGKVAQRPYMFINEQQINRAKQQVVHNEDLKRSVESLQQTLEKNLRSWRKMIPERATPYSMNELFEIAKITKTRPDLMTESAAMILYPSQEVATVLREKMLYEIGIHKDEGSWRELGIHQGERLGRFLQAYDIACHLSIFSEEEHEAIISELHQAARFLEAWTLESPINYIFQGQTYCFNIKYYPICMLGVIGMYFPEFEESALWVEKAQDQVTRLLLTENFADGAYGENSIHYWAPTTDGILLYITASHNLGYKDYMKDYTFRNFFQKFMRWRANLTTTDGRKVAIGDAHRCEVGSKELLDAAYLLEDHTLAWIVKSIHERVHGGYLLSPQQLLTFNASFRLEKPQYNYANYIWSGYGIYRSGWNADDNFIMMKYGPTWAGRREIEKKPVIAGHSHQDCMGIEMLYHGIPMFVDGGYRGVYANYETYGGFWKATIAHNTVGLGNDYGYSRTDGLFKEHINKHGKEFRYEKEQINTYRNSTRLMSFSDVEDVVLLSAKATTYENVEHERSIVWFRENSLTIVHDNLTSPYMQNYEWYLNPVGHLISSDKNYIIGDEKARLAIVEVGKQSPTTIIGRGTKGIPDYYYPFRNDFKDEPRWDGPNARWANYTLMVKSQKADSTAFFNVLIPFHKTNPYTIGNWGKKGKKLSSSYGHILISEETNEKGILVNGRFAVVCNNSAMQPQEYTLSNGYELSVSGRSLIKTELYSLPWKELYKHKVTGLVGLKSQRATFVLEPDPWNEYVLIHDPKIEEGKEPPVPIRVKVSFYTGKRPVKMVRERSNESIPSLHNPEFDNKIEKARFYTGLKNYAKIESRMARVDQDFEYDDSTGIVSTLLPPGFNHLVWE